MSVESKPKTFSRSRVIDLIKRQYRHANSLQKSYQKSLHLLKEVESKNSYELFLVRYNEEIKTARKILCDICEGFSISYDEIDPNMEDWINDGYFKY